MAGAVAAAATRRGDERRWRQRREETLAAAVAAKGGTLAATAAAVEEGDRVGEVGVDRWEQVAAGGERGQQEGREALPRLRRRPTPPRQIRRRPTPPHDPDAERLLHEPAGATPPRCIAAIPPQRPSSSSADPRFHGTSRSRRRTGRPAARARQRRRRSSRLRRTRSEYFCLPRFFWSRPWGLGNAIDKLPILPGVFELDEIGYIGAFGKELSEKDRKFLNLVEMGFTGVVAMVETLLMWSSGF